MIESYHFTRTNNCGTRQRPAWEFTCALCTYHVRFEPGKLVVLDRGEPAVRHGGELSVYELTGLQPPEKPDELTYELPTHIRKKIEVIVSDYDNWVKGRQDG